MKTSPVPVTSSIFIRAEKALELRVKPLDSDKEFRSKFVVLNNPTGRTRPLLCEFLSRIYNASSYFCISPGTVYGTYGSASTVYIFRKRKLIFQRSVLLLQIWSLMALILVELYTSKTSILQEWECPNFSILFRIFLGLLWVGMLVDLFRTFRNNYKGFSQILNKVQLINELFEGAGIPQPRSKLVRHLAIFLMLLVFLWGCFGQIFINVEAHKKHFTTVLWDLVYGIPHLRNPPILSSKTQGAGSKSADEIALNSIQYWLLSIPLFAGVFIAEFGAYFAVVTVLAHTIVFYILVTSYTDFLKLILKQNSEPREFNQLRHTVLTILEELCGLSELFEETIGSTVAFSCLDILTYFANLVSQISSVGLVILIQVLIYSAVQGTFLILAAEANSKIDYLAFWLQNFKDKKAPEKCFVVLSRTNVEGMDKWATNERIYIALYQLEKNQVGIRGRSFTVTYGFVGKMLGLLLSYSILFAQLEASG